MENEALDIRQRNPTALVEWAEKTVKDLESWWHKEWWSHLWMVGVSNGLAVLVPFGLAILLYIPDTLKMKLNVALILCSGVSLILQVIDHALRRKDRATILRDAYEDLRHGLALYKSGAMTFEKFEAVTTEIKDNYLKRDMGNV